MVAPGLTGPAAGKPRWRGVALVLLWAGVGVGALLLLAKSVQNSGEFSRLQPWILLLNVIGVVALTALLARKLTQLVRDYRAHVPGSRLTARTVAIFGALVVAPLLIVYLFSLQFLNRGIDSWFHVEVKQGLSDALVLSRAALDLRVSEYSRHTEKLAHSLVNASAEDVAQRVYEERRTTAALEMAVFGAHERIVAASLENPLESLPTRPPPDLVRQVGERRAMSALSRKPAASTSFARPRRSRTPRRGPMIATSSRSMKCRRSSPRSRRLCSTLILNTASLRRCVNL